MNALETHVLRLIGENTSSPDVFTDNATGIAQIRQSLNDGIQELCMVTGSYTKTYHLALLEGRSFYRLSPVTDFIAYPLEVWDRLNKRKLYQTDPLTLAHIDPYWMQYTGPALQYMILGLDVFGVHYKPSNKGNLLEIRCACIPKPYTTDTAPVKVREAFQRAVVYYAVSEFYASRGDAGRGTEYGQKYLETAMLLQLHPGMAERQYQFKGGGQEDKGVE